jgi:UDP-glucose 4-epimerase
MNVLITGGAGYVGSIVTEELIARGHNTVVFDNLSSGHRQAVPRAACFVQGDIGDTAIVRRTLVTHQVEAVVHMAAESVIARSVTNPLLFYKENVAKSLLLLECAVLVGIRRLVFSSSAAVYGRPARVPITEDQPTAPVSAYGHSKSMFETALRDVYQADGLNSISLRYFNAAGASSTAGEDHPLESHLIPGVLSAMRRPGGQIELFGTKHATPDGTCIRDFVHVQDIADAHALALDRLDDIGCAALNIGTSRGASVLEVVQTARMITGQTADIVERPPRPGDPAVLVASRERAESLLGWTPKRTLPDMVQSAWERMLRHPNGYGSMVA